MDKIFLLFVWIHIVQQGIWDMETRKLSRSPNEFPLYPGQTASFAELSIPSTQLFKHLELGERLDGLTGAGQDAEGVEADLYRYVRYGSRMTMVM